jgi:hypothetical protein
LLSIGCGNFEALGGLTRWFWVVFEENNFWVFKYLKRNGLLRANDVGISRGEEGFAMARRGSSPTA